jgi:hypothetical protein
MSANSSICTLFEGHYHYGVGALVNSFYRHGYRGVIWAGCRGSLPPWASPLAHHSDYAEYQVGDGCVIRFIPVETTRHLTNYKPEFMLDLWRRFPAEIPALFYFDPDIVIKCDWSFFEEWIHHGVALCEDVNSPVNPTHPLRLRWQSFFGAQGVKLNSSHAFFVNGGFVGLSRENMAFLEEWLHLLEMVKPHAENLARLHLGERTLLFQIPDQDALNATVYSTRTPVSVLGREGMDFIPGGYTMSHAAGGAKPWKKQMLRSALGGVPPSAADKGFWQNVEAPIELYPKLEIARNRLNLRLAAAIGRFLRRS